MSFDFGDSNGDTQMERPRWRGRSLAVSAEPVRLVISRAGDALETVKVTSNKKINPFRLSLIKADYSVSGGSERIKAAD